MRCSHCGEQLDHGWGLCPACRKPIDAPSFRARLWQGLIRMLAPKPKPIRRGNQLIYDGGMLSHLPPDLREKVLDGLDSAAQGPDGRRTVNVSETHSVEIPLENFDQLPPEIRRMIEQARASGKSEVQVYTEVTTIDPVHGKRVQREGTPIDPQTREQIERLSAQDQSKLNIRRHA